MVATLMILTVLAWIVIVIRLDIRRKKSDRKLCFLRQLSQALNHKLTATDPLDGTFSSQQKPGY
jgi:hypothetical protein